MPGGTEYQNRMTGTVELTFLVTQVVSPEWEGLKNQWPITTCAQSEISKLRLVREGRIKTNKQNSQLTAKQIRHSLLNIRLCTSLLSLASVPLLKPGAEDVAGSGAEGGPFVAFFRALTFHFLWKLTRYFPRMGGLQLRPVQIYGHTLSHITNHGGVALGRWQRQIHTLRRNFKNVGNYLPA